MFVYDGAVSINGVTFSNNTATGGAREVLGDLAQALHTLREREGKSRAYDLVNKTHINLLRRWSEP